MEFIYYNLKAYFNANHLLFRIYRYIFIIHLNGLAPAFV